MAENTPTTFDDRNLPIASGLSDLLQKTGKIQNTNLGEQVMSNNQVNNLIDVTKLNLPALQGYGFNGYKNLNADEQSFLNNQSQSQVNQFNTLQNQLLLANLKGNQAVSAQVQNLKSNTGQFFDGAGVNANNSSLGLSLLNNANNIGNEQIRNNNQEMANQLSQAQNQFKQTQVQLQGQALQQANTNKQYDRNLFESDRSYGTQTTGNIFVKDEKTGEAKVKLDSKNNPVYTNQKIQQERAYQDSKDQYYTGLFGTLYNKNQPVIGSDGKPLFTQQGISNQLAVEAGKLSNTQASMNLNKMMLLQDSDIAAAIANNGLIVQKSINGITEQKSLLAGGGVNGSKSVAPTINSPKIDASDAAQVAKYNFTEDDNKTLGFKNADGSDVVDKAAFKESDTYKKAIEKAVIMKNTFGEGYGSLFTITTIAGSKTDPSKPGSYVISPIDQSKADSIILSPYTFLDGVRLDTNNDKAYAAAKTAYSNKIKASIIGDDIVPKLFIKSQLNSNDPNERSKTIIGISGKNGDPYDPTSSTNFAEVDMTKLSVEQASQFQKEYYDIANSKANGTADKVYNKLLTDWEKVDKDFVVRKTSNQVIDLLSQPEYLANGTNTIEGQVTRDLVMGMIAKGNRGNIAALTDPKPGDNGVSFKELGNGIRSLTNYNSRSDSGVLDLFRATDLGNKEFSNVRADTPDQVVDVYNSLSPTRKTEMRRNFSNLFISGYVGGAVSDKQKMAFANLGLALNKDGTKAEPFNNKANESANSTWGAINSLFNYTRTFEPANIDDRTRQMNQVKSILKTTGVGNEGVANMLADIFTPLGKAYG